MDRPEKLDNLLNSAGYDSVRAWSESFAYPLTVERLLAIQVGCGMASRRLSTLPKATRTACRSRVAERLAHLTERERVYRPNVLYTVAKRPG
jgi:hypothetical protein